LQTDSFAKAEHLQLNALETRCGLLDWEKSTIVRHSGPDALDLLDRLTTKSLDSLGLYNAQRTVLTTAAGRVIDTFLVARVADIDLLLISDSRVPDKIISAINYYTIVEDAAMTDHSMSLTRLSLIGPKSRQVLQKIWDLDLEKGLLATVKYGENEVTIISDDSRKVDWVDLIVDPLSSKKLRSELLKKGAVAISADHFEHFRINFSIPGADAEYGEHSNPIEAGLLSLIDFDKGCYVGQEVIARLDTYNKVQRDLRVLTSAEPLNERSKLISGSSTAGIVTSVSHLETPEGNFVSLALVRKAYLASGTELNADGIAVAVK
tara:strand:- start:1413 stop:2375 length:963 start_codon:yes stop_codon:yes gene_type:complete